MIYITEYVNPAAYDDESMPEHSTQRNNTVTILHDATVDSHSDDSDIPEISAGKTREITQYCLHFTTLSQTINDGSVLCCNKDLKNTAKLCICTSDCTLIINQIIVILSSLIHY